MASDVAGSVNLFRNLYRNKGEETFQEFIQEQGAGFS